MKLNGWASYEYLDCDLHHKLIIANSMQAVYAIIFAKVQKLAFDVSRLEKTKRHRNATEYIVSRHFMVGG